MSYKCNKCVSTGVPFQSWPHWSRGGICLLRNSVWYCIVGYSSVAKISLTGPGATSLMMWSFDYILTPPWGQTLGHHIFLTALVFMQRETVCSCVGVHHSHLAHWDQRLPVFQQICDIVSLERGNICTVSEYSSLVLLIKFLWAVHIKGFQKKIGLDKILLSQFFPFFSALASLRSSVCAVCIVLHSMFSRHYVSRFISILGNDRVCFGDLCLIVTVGPNSMLRVYADSSSTSCLRQCSEALCCLGYSEVSEGPLIFSFFSDSRIYSVSSDLYPLVQIGLWFYLNRVLGTDKTN